jgi:hypothetical protein
MANLMNSTINIIKMNSKKRTANFIVRVLLAIIISS